MKRTTPLKTKKTRQDPSNRILFSHQFSKTEQKKRDEIELRKKAMDFALQYYSMIEPEADQTVTEYAIRFMKFLNTGK